MVRLLCLHLDLDDAVFLYCTGLDSSNENLERRKTMDLPGALSAAVGVGHLCIRTFAATFLLEQDN